PVEVPSVLFLEGETAEAVAPERVRLDAELLLALAAAALLALAAASPRVSSSPAGRVVRVVLDGGSWSQARSRQGELGAKRADDAWGTIRNSLSGSDRIETVHARG